MSEHIADSVFLDLGKLLAEEPADATDGRMGSLRWHRAEPNTPAPEEKGRDRRSWLTLAVALAIFCAGLSLGVAVALGATDPGRPSAVVTPAPPLPPRRAASAGSTWSAEAPWSTWSAEAPAPPVPPRRAASAWSTWSTEAPAPPVPPAPPASQAPRAAPAPPQPARDRSARFLKDTLDARDCEDDNVVLFEGCLLQVQLGPCGSAAVHQIGGAVKDFARSARAFAKEHAPELAMAVLGGLAVALGSDK